MESVLDVLKAMGKASAREIAARMKIEPIEALNMLRDHESQNLVTLLNGYWQIADGKTAAPPAQATPVLRSKNVASSVVKPKRKVAQQAPCRPERLTPEEEFHKIRSLLMASGDMETTAIAKELKRDSRGMVSTLRLLERQGKLRKTSNGKVVIWGLADVESVASPTVPETAAVPGVAPAPATISPMAECEADSTRKFLDSIPVLSKSNDLMQVPTLKEISKKIRRAKSDVTRLEKLQVAVRELVKHRRTIRLLSGEGE